MAQVSTESLTEMSTEILWGKGRPARKADNLIAFCELLSTKCKGSDVSQT
jgi:hypothetical protein